MGSVMPILTAADLAGAQVGDILLLVPDPNGGPMGALHVIVSNSGSGNLVVRSMINQGSGNLGPVVTFGVNPGDGGSSNGAFSPTTASVTPGGQLTLHGNLFQQYMGVSAALGDLSFPLDSNEQVTAATPPTFTAWQTPDACVTNGYFAKQAFTPVTNGVTSYVAACADNSNAASLWMGDSQPTTTPTMLATGMKNDLLMNPTAYALVSGQSFITYSASSSTPTGAFAFGTTAAALTTPTSFALTAGQVGFSTGIVPLPANDGFALFMVSVTPNLAMGGLWDGPVHPADFTTLGSTPPPTLHKLATIGNIGDIAPIAPSASDATTIYSAASTISKTQVDFSWTLRDGTPLVLNQKVYSSANATCMSNDSCNTILAAGAAPLGLGTLVFWTEQTTDTPPVTTVNAVEFVCATSG
jgi:hypothetical protein